MSEDSIASNSISCRTEATAPLLPPRKRLLAGFKQNGWPSPPSSSRSPAAPLEPPPSKETLAPASAAKTDDLDQNSGDAADGGSLESLNDRGSLQSLNGAAESLDSQSEGRRKPERQRAHSSPAMKKGSKKKKKLVSPDGDEHLLDRAVDDAITSLVVDEEKLSVASKTSLETEKHSLAVVEGEAPAGGKEERVTTANGKALAGHIMIMKLGSNSVSLHKEEDEAKISSRKADGKITVDFELVVKANDTPKHRKRSSRQKQIKDKEAELRKLHMQREKAERMPLPLADEELARQLHRSMNSSPRIARCINPKEERPFLASSRKRFSGS